MSAAGESRRVAEARRLRGGPAVLRRRLGQACPRREERVGAIVARMDDAERLPRLGPLARRTAASALHIINQWPDDALEGRRQRPTAEAGQVAPRRRHLRRLRQGRGRARSTSNGKPQPIERRSRQRSPSTIRTDVPFKSASDSTTAPLRRRRRSKTCASTPARLSDGEVAARWRGPRRRSCSRRSPPSAAAAENDELFDWWLLPRPRVLGLLSSSRSKLRALASERKAIQRARHGRPRDAGEDRRAADGLRPLSAASTTSAATRSKPARPPSCRRLPADLPQQPAGPRPVAAATRAIR